MDPSDSPPDDPPFTVIGLELGEDDPDLDENPERLDERMAATARYARRVRRVVRAWRAGRSCCVVVNARPWGHLSTDGISILYGGTDCLLTRQLGLVPAPDRRPVLLTKRPFARRRLDTYWASGTIRDTLEAKRIPFIEVCARMGSFAVRAKDLRREYARQLRIARLIESGEITSIVRRLADAWLADREESWEEDWVQIATGNRSLWASPECVLTRAENGAALLSGRRYAPGTLNRAVRDELHRYFFVRRFPVHEVPRPTRRSCTDPDDLRRAWAQVSQAPPVPGSGR